MKVKEIPAKKQSESAFYYLLIPLQFDLISKASFWFTGKVNH